MNDRYGHPRQSITQPGRRRHASATASVAYSSASTAQQQQQQPPPAALAPPKPARPQRQLQFTAPRWRGAVDADGDTVVVDEADDDDYAARRGGRAAEQGSSSSIVVRDANGDFEVEEPPSLLGVGLDAGAEGEALDPRLENEKIRQKLADAVKEHQSQRSSVPAQPEELLEVIKASLRAKVAALVEDKWMYEKEEEPRPVE